MHAASTMPFSFAFWCFIIIPLQACRHRNPTNLKLIKQMHITPTAELPLPAHGFIPSSYSVLLLFKYKQHCPTIAVMGVSRSKKGVFSFRTLHPIFHIPFLLLLLLPCQELHLQLLCPLKACKQRWAPTFIHHLLLSQQWERKKILSSC